MLAAPAVSSTAHQFSPTSANFGYSVDRQQQQQQHHLRQQIQQQTSYQSSSDSASMSYSHGRGGMSISSNSSRGGAGGLPYQSSNYPMPNGNGVVGIGMTQASSSSTITAQANGNNAIRRPRRPDSEEIKRVGRMHYQELFQFLRTHLAKGQRGPRTNAREKLTRLSQQQFTELSTDVYDELMRRINNARTGAEMPHLAVREEFHPKRNQARQKLATLPKTRFKDLSSDVFFELERRFPYLRDEYRPEVSERERREEEDAIKMQEMNRRQVHDDRRNSALSSTVDREELTAEEEYTRSMPGNLPAAATKTDVLIPAKSTLVEEEIAVPYAQSSARDTNDWTASNDRQNSRDSVLTSMDGDHNRNTMYSQVSSVGTGFYNGYANSRATESVASPHIANGEGFAASNIGEEKMRSDYEFRIATLQHKLTSLEAKNADFEKEKAEQIENLEKRIQEQQASHGATLSALTREIEQHRDQHEQNQNQLSQTLSKLDDLQAKHESLVQEHSQRSAATSESSRAQEDLAVLQKEYSEQEEVMAELRAEVTNLVEELRQLSLRNDEILSDKDNDEAIIRDLNNQVSSYKRKYENAKTELRNLKATSQLFVQAPKADDFMPASEEGVIADVSLTAFQSSIDELVAAARSKAPSNVLIAMKTVVLATTLITDDVFKYEQRDSATADVREQVLVIKGRISNTLNNLMTACRNHASSYGMSPVSLLDAAASHVSTSIVDMVKLLKVRKATKAEAEEFEATFTQNGTLPNGLKPLHTNILSSASINTAPFSPATSEFRRQGSVLKGEGTESRLGPNSSLSSLPGDGRYSPRTRHNPTMGRYSPVTYRSDVPRKNSNGTGSWQPSEDDRARKTSDSSHTSSKTPVVPVIDGAILNLARSVSSNSSARSPHLDTAASSFDTEIKANAALAALRASIIPPPSISPLGDDSTEENWAELRNYIEVQTEAIVHSIQALLSSIREGAQGNQLNENLTQITTIVSSIIAISKDNIPKATAHSTSPTADLDGEKILQELTENCEKLIEMQMIGKFDKLTKSNMASASYGVAKGLKALSGLLSSDDR